MNDILKSHIALFFANLIYALTFTLAKDIMPDTIQPMGLILIRIMGAMLLFHLAHRLWVKETVKRKDYGLLILCGLFGVALNMTFFLKGLNYTTPIHAAVTMTSAPIIIFILAVIFHGEKKSTPRILGVALGAVGAIVLAVYGREFETGIPKLAQGNLYVFINAVSYAIYLTLVKPLMSQYHFLTITKWMFTVAFVVILPFGIDELFLVEWKEISKTIWAEIAFVVVGTSFLAYLCNIYALKRLQASTVGFYIYLQPVLATIIALMLGSDQLDPIKILASFIIFLGVYLVSRKTKAVEP
ncbi:DMT family transporter [Flavobacteriales bacterium]|jgi:drug/metabolite transporter (DMT)-like permease|nr:DMT family transporter [Flavobacteriales bacterium]